MKKKLCRLLRTKRGVIVAKIWFKHSQSRNSYVKDAFRSLRLIVDKVDAI